MKKIILMFAIINCYSMFLCGYTDSVAIAQNAKTIYDGTIYFSCPPRFSWNAQSRTLSKNDGAGLGMIKSGAGEMNSFNSAQITGLCKKYINSLLPMYGDQSTGSRITSSNSRTIGNNEIHERTFAVYWDKSRKWRIDTGTFTVNDVDWWRWAFVMNRRTRKGVVICINGLSDHEYNQLIYSLNLN